MLNAVNKINFKITLNELLCFFRSVGIQYSQINIHYAILKKLQANVS